MTRTPTPTSLRALRDLAAVWTAATLAATAWASGIHEEGFILDAPAFHSEVAGVPSPDWPVDGWYRLAPRAKAIEVSAVAPSAAERADDPEGTLYVRVPGARLQEGLRPKYRFAGEALQPKVGHQYELLLGRTRFSFSVDSGPEGMRYEIGYGGQAHTYLIGLPAATTRVQAIADLDGDAMPDFVLDVGDETYLLLSTRAQPGHNAPSAQLWAMGGC